MKILNYSVLICLGFVITALFLPFYETWVNEFEIQKQVGIGIYRIYDSEDNGFIVVHNGLGSFYGLFSSFICLLLAIGIFLIPRENAISIIALIFYLLALIIMLIGSVNFGKPIGDKMLLGFYFIFLSQTFLIIFSFFKAYRLNESDKYVEY